MLNMLVLSVIIMSGYEAILASERNIIREYQAIYLTELIFVDIGDINSDVYIAPQWFNKLCIKSIRKLDMNSDFSSSNNIWAKVYGFLWWPF